MLCRTALSSGLFFVALWLYSVPVRAQTEQSWSPCLTSPTKTVDAPLDAGGDHPNVVIAMKSGSMLPSARAEIVTGEEAGRGIRLLNAKYAPWKWLFDLFPRFKRRGRVVFAIHPA